MAREIDRQIEEDRPAIARSAALKNWLAAERFRRLQDYLSDLGWTYGAGMTRHNIHRWIAQVWSDRGRGEISRHPIKIREIESGVQLRHMSDAELRRTWEGLQALPAAIATLTPGPWDDTRTVAEWIEAVYWEILYRWARDPAKWKPPETLGSDS